MKIITHRGLEPNKKKFFAESSLEAFKNQISRGFGLEFDPVMCKDGFVVMHDTSLERITKGKDKRAVRFLGVDELKKINLNPGTIPTLEEMLELIRDHDCLCALHLKSHLQDQNTLTKLIKTLEKYEDAAFKILIFDTTFESAKFLCEKLPTIMLAPSVVHPFDKTRFNEVTGKTLYTLEDISTQKEFFSWVWLDEWDLLDENGSKTLYNKTTFDYCKQLGLKIALVSPELHRTSPCLLGGEKHPDAINKDVLMKRVKEIIDLKPDLICTDYPEEIRDLSARARE